jgi:NTE family protein
VIKNNSKGKIAVDEIGLALGGGWARGILHIQFLKVFDTLGLRPKIMAGTSIGAIIGSLYASGCQAQEIEKIFRDLNLRDLGSLLDFKFGDRYGFIKGNKIEELIREKTSSREFKDLVIPLKIVASDFWEGKEYIIDQGPVYKAVRASISIPGIFEPVKAGDRILIDGGTTNPVPYDIIAGECRTVIAIDALGDRLSRKTSGETPTIFESIISSIQIAQEVLVRDKLNIKPPDLYIKPSLKNIGPLDFHRAGEILKETGDCIALENILKISIKKRERKIGNWISRIAELVSLRR